MYSKQMTLGECIKKLEEIKSDFNIEFDFGGISPTTLNSWRGRYDELALGFAGGEYSSGIVKTVGELLEEFKSAVGKTYSGWKGGDFVMTESTPVWVDNPGRCTYTYITDIRASEYDAMILTNISPERW